MNTLKYLSLINGNPIAAGEPFVVFNVVDAIFQISVTFRQINLQQILQQIFQVRRKMRRETHLNDKLQISFSSLKFSSFQIPLETPSTTKKRKETLQKTLSYLARDDLFVDLDRLVGEKRRIPGSHFINQHPQRPPIHRLIITLKN